MPQILTCSNCGHSWIASAKAVENGALCACIKCGQTTSASRASYVPSDRRHA